MLHRSNRLRTLLVTSALFAASACKAGSEDGLGGQGDATTATGATTSTGMVASSSGAGFITSTTGSGGGVPQIAEVFGHSATQLYKLNPDTKAVGIVGSFNGCNGILDIALDKDSNLFATNNEGLYKVDLDTVVCTKIADGMYPNSLSFVPKGTVDPNEEALVGYVEDANDQNQFVRIDPTTGALSNIGAPWSGPYAEYVSSGDIVSVIGGPTYLTIKRGDCDPLDCLVEINPTTGQVKAFLGSVGYGKVFGMAFWAGKAYGFTNDGKLFEINRDANDNITTALIPTNAMLQFWGAGSTTSAPPVPK